MVEEPPSQLAIWSRRLALFALAVALIALVLVRGRLVETLPGLVALLAALVLAAFAVLLALGAFVVIWINGNPGLRHALSAFFIGALLLAYPIYIAAQAHDLPAIYDVSTDTADPPRFEVIARLRPRGANPIEYPGQVAAEKQRDAYPEIAPLVLAATPADAYNAALEVVSRRNWTIVDARAPQAGRRDGRIEAVATTLVMGFRDDLIIRVRASGNGALVDIRSASRYGSHDLGSNAERVRSLMAEIEEEVGAQPAASQ